MSIKLNVIRKPDEFCKPCGLYRECKTPVMNGEGGENPTWLFVGEAPGRDEDEEGYPFAGESGSILRGAIEEVGISLEKCRFTNVVRCRPPDNNLKAWPNAVEHCRPHILREIRATRPKVIVLIGNTATASILNRHSGILKLHGEVIDIRLAKIVCMFHPSYLLRNNTPETRKKFYDAIRVAKRIGLGKTTKTQTKKRNHVVIKDRLMLKEFVDIIKKSEYPATDTESSTLSPFAVNMKPEVGCVGISWYENEACCFPVHVRTELSGCKIKPEESIEAIKELWEDPNLKWIAHHSKHDMVYMTVLHKIWLGGKGHKTGAYFDTMLGSYALDERRGIHGLKDWAARVGMADYDQPLRQHKLMYPKTDPDKGGNLLLVPADILYPYNMDDCIATRRLFFKQRKKLKEQKLWHNPLMFPLMYINWIAAMMQIVGMNVSLERNEELIFEFNKKIAKLDEKLYEFTEVKQLQEMFEIEILEKLRKRVKNYKRPVPNVKKKVFELFENISEEKKTVNLNSPDWKRKLVFDILEYEPIEETNTGLPSAEAWILEELYKNRKHPVLGSILKRSMFQSAYNKYIGPIKEWIGSDKRIHSSFNPHGTVTGRPSSEDPNLYNLPARHELTDVLMSQFTPRNKNFVIAKQDSKQIELRLIADRAKDKTMIKEFREGKDPHAMGAQAAFEKSEKAWAKLKDKIIKKLRNFAKNAVSFGLVYGRQAAALAADFGWPTSKAKAFKTRYFAKYHGIAAFLESEAERIKEQKESISSFGRHRRVPEVESEDEAVQARAIREAINAPIQGDASDINLIAAYRFQRWAMANNLKTRVFLFVYDAVWLDAYRPELPVVIPKLKFFMTDRKYLMKTVGWDLRVPLDTDCAIGEKNAGSMIELQRDKNNQFVIPPELTKLSV